MSQYQRKDPPWSHVGVPNASTGLGQAMMQQNTSLLGAQPGGLATNTSNVYGQSMVGGNMATTAYPSQQAMQQRQSMALQQQVAAAQNAAVSAQGSASGQPQLTVSYPTTRQTQGTQPRQRVFTGTVTKLHDTFGFVDEDVFFQTNTVKGAMPKIADRVLVEATYNASMPFKWNATRIQLLNNSMEQGMAAPPPQQHHAALKMQQMKQMQPPTQRMDSNVSQQFKMLKQQQPLLKAPQGGMMPNQPPPGLLGNPPPLLQQPPQQVVGGPPMFNNPNMQNMGYGNQNRLNQMGQAPMGRRDTGPAAGPSSRDRERERDREQRDRDRAQRERERERDREQRDRERELNRERRERERRERDKSPIRKRSRSPHRSKSPRRSPRRTKRPVPRYVVQIPRFALDIPKSDVIELHKRYGNMYIPSDFYLANFVWQDVFQIHRPMNVAQPGTFHIMHKEATAPQGAATVIDPPDANYSFCAKVMLMSSVSQEELYEKCCARAQDSSDVRDNFQHPTRLLNFLVGTKGKNEVMAIGGPWSPSLDGADPVNNSAVLVKTAIRTTKALTGIDLSSCTQWYRFLELNYHRPEENHKGRHTPARIETVVIFVPDVWHVLPTKVEWDSVTELYKKTLAKKLASLEVKEKKPEEEATTQEEPSQEEEEEAESEPEKKTPTHWKELDPKNLKVNELRQELELRGLNSKGLKSQLIARLTKTLKTEQETEDAEGEAMETEAALEAAKAEEEAAKAEEEEKKEEDEKEKKEREEKERKEEEERKKKEAAEEEKRRKIEREKRDLESRYSLPETAAILVHPSPIAKSGKFDCAVQSLSVLLDYRVDDSKEHSFEVFLFAELFNEMLQRDFAFNMYKAICKAPEKKEEKKEDKKKEKEKDKKEEKKEEKDDKDESKAKRRKTDDKEEEGKDKEEEKKDEDSKEDEKEGDDEDDDGKSNIDDADDDKKDKGDKDKKERKVRPKLETLDPALLLSCIYFDQNHTGYILERDLEEILYTIGIHLSRAQVRKLLQKVVSRDCWNYRKMTDGPKKEDGAATPDVNGQLSDEDLGKGNLMIQEQMPLMKKSPKGSGPDEASMVKYGGTVIDVANLLKQVTRADQEKSAADKKIEELEREIDTLRNRANSTEQTVTHVSGELVDVQSRLNNTEKSLVGTTIRSKRLIDVIGSAQKNLDEIMLRFNEVLEEALIGGKPEVKVKGELKAGGDAVLVPPPGAPALEDSKMDVSVKAEPVTPVKTEAAVEASPKASPKVEVKAE